jgi:Ser-tRNA(Ala) deacylase AlaX
METIKLHHHNPFLSRCEAEVMQIDPIKGIVLDQSIAYAESGGQQGDTGLLIIQSNGAAEAIPFTDTQKGYGRLLLLKDFPTIPVQTPTYHRVSPDDLGKFHPGQKVTVQINTERRGLLTISHSGIHLVLMGLEQKYPGIYTAIKGCSIKPTGARLDFGIDQKFTGEDVAFVQDFVQNQIALNKEMFVYQHRQEAEAWYWQMDDYIVPCGGSHLYRTANIGCVTVKKENLGRSSQRMAFTFDHYQLPEYHEKK